MTSRSEQLKLSAQLVLSLSALLLIALSGIITAPAAAQYSGNERQLIAEKNDNNDPQFQSSAIDGDGARKNSFAGNGGAGAADSDMPGWRMRKRYRQSGQGGGTAVDAGAPDQAGSDDMPGRRQRAGAADGGNGDDMPYRRAGQQGAMEARMRAAAAARFAQGGFPGGFPGQAGGFPGQGGGGGFAARALDLTPLGLSDSQKDKIKAMREQTKLKLRDLKKGLNDKQNEMKNLMFNPDSTESQIKAARLQVRKLQDQMDETNMNDLLVIRSMLTPDQKKRWPDCMPGRRATANGGGMPFPPGGPFPPGQGPPPGAGSDGVPAGTFAGGFGGPGGGGDNPGIRNKRGRRRALEADNDNGVSR